MSLTSRITGAFPPSHSVTRPIYLTHPPHPPMLAHILLIHPDSAPAGADKVTAVKSRSRSIVSTNIYSFRLSIALLNVCIVYYLQSGLLHGNSCTGLPVGLPVAQFVAARPVLACQTRSVSDLVCMLIFWQILRLRLNRLAAEVMVGRVKQKRLELTSERDSRE